MRYHDTLSLSREGMRTLGYRVIDLLVEHFDSVSDKPVSRKADHPMLEPLLRESLPENGVPAGDVLEQLEHVVFNRMMHLDHPRFFAFVPSPSNFVGVMADALASGFNVFAGTWLEASGPAAIELVTIDWLRQVCGLPDTAGGLCVSGGSMANITALAVARHVKLHDMIDGAVVYCSDQTHCSIDRGLRVLGFAAEQLRKLPTDTRFGLDLEALGRAVSEDRAAGRIPFCVVANAGTTNTGAVDPLSALAAYSRQESLWLHVDGAYGAAAVFCGQGQALLEGLGRADSVSLDPHKWLFQPYEIGCVLMRDRRWLKETFHILPEYLHDAAGAGEEVNFSDCGIELTRSFRALKLWMSLKVFGRAGFQEAVRRGFEHAECAEAAVRRLVGWEVVTPAQMGVVTFRCAPRGMTAQEVDLLNHNLVEEVIRDGFAMISSTTLRGRAVLRMCPINPRTTKADIEATITKLDELSAKLGGRNESE